MKRYIAVILISTAIFSNANAEDLPDLPLNWDIQEGRAATFFFSSDDWASAEAYIDQTPNSRYVGFHLYSKANSKRCKFGLTIGERKSQNFKVNGQAIQGGFVCKKFTDDDAVYYRFYAVTEAGDNFIINTFRKSKEVRIEHILRDFTLSAIGFEKAFNNQSEKAL